MIHKAFLILIGMGLMGLVGILTGVSNPEEEAAATKTVDTSAVALADQHVKPVAIPSYMEFAGEEVPLADYDIKERLDRELLVNTYWHSSTIKMMKTANRYFPLIEQILAEQGVPDDFKYLALIESGLDMQARSSAGAKGPWQFLSATAKQYKLEVADRYNYEEVDERYHIEKSTVAACKYLKNEYESFGNWTLAAAAYNAGHGRIRGTKTKQLVDSYYDMYLTTETSRYVFRILAVKAIFQNPEKYGFFIENSSLYQPVPTREMTVASIPNIPEFAKGQGFTYKEFKLLNPWLRSTKLTARKSGKKYTVKLPL